MARRAVSRTFRRLREQRNMSSDFVVRGKMLQPVTSDRWFVKVIGRGYPPPTNKFRWCTDRLRIRPIAQELQKYRGKKTLILGTRWDESPERQRTMRRHAKDGSGFRFHHSDRPDIEIFAPVAHLDEREVWSLLLSPNTPSQVGGPDVYAMYQAAGVGRGGECPTLPGQDASPCGAGRFGCWTCTVVRTDKAMRSMVTNGHTSMAPLLEWRNWVMHSRDLPSNRWPMRRNGAPGPGPLTMKFRRRMLDRLLAAESASGLKLISAREILAIRELWRQDGARR